MNWRMLGLGLHAAPGQTTGGQPRRPAWQAAGYAGAGSLAARAVFLHEAHGPAAERIKYPSPLETGGTG
jgi:hypothetical protein